MKELLDRRTITEVAGMSMNDMMDKLRAAIRAAIPSAPNIEGPWCKEVYDDYLIYDYNGKLYQVSYSWGADDQPVLGVSAEVIEQTSYVPVTPAVAEAALEGDFCELVEGEAALGAAKLIKIIEPGWGSSGYYSEEALKAAAPVYAPGTHMYWNHPGKIDEKNRPERDLRDLAAKTTEAAYYDEAGPKGPGLYAKAQVFEHYLPAVNELAADIGVSHRATGTRKMGEAEGKKGPVIEAITAVHSIDFVTKPGAGGEIIQLFEAARPATHEISQPELTLDVLKREHPELVEALRTEIKSAVYGAKDKLKEDKRMNEDEIKVLEEAKAEAEDKAAKLAEENARLREAEVLREAKELVTAKVAESKLPDVTKARLTESLAANPPISEGKLDTEKYSQHIDEALTAEAEYIATITESGKIRGMGSSAPAGTEGRALLKESFKVSFMNQGKTAEEAEALAESAVNSNR